MFIDPQWSEKSLLLTLSLGTMKQMMENDCEIVCFGDVLDKCGSEMKAEVFRKLKTTYELLGQRFREYVWKGNTVDWDVSGPFYAGSENAQAYVACKVFGEPWPKFWLTPNIVTPTSRRPGTPTRCRTCSQCWAGSCGGA